MSGLLGGFGASGYVDDDGDGVITRQEVRAAHYGNRMAQDARVDTVADQFAGMSADVLRTQKKYTPSMERALERWAHSNEMWSRYAKEDAKEKKKAEVSDEAKRARDDAAADEAGRSDFDVWEATKAGKRGAVMQYLRANPDFDMRKHDTTASGYGDTLLHHAVWNGHVSLVKALIRLAELRFGPDGRRAFVNDIDTANSRTTPLICASRTKVGFLNDRLTIVKLLVQAGADAAAQDSSGDNCLHWAARVSSLPIIRYLTRHTEGAVFASVADNNKMKKPIDIAERIDIEKWRVNEECVRDKKNPLHCSTCKSSHYSSVTTVEVYRLLLQLLKGCNVRLKIQKGKVRRLDDEGRRKQAILDRRDKLLVDSLALLKKARGELVRQHEVAEAQRTKEEEELMNARGDAAVEEFEGFIKTSKEGRRILSQAHDAVFRQMKEEARKAGKKTSRDTKKVALAKAKAQLFKERHNMVAEKTQVEYRRRNPVIKIPKLKKLA